VIASLLVTASAGVIFALGAAHLVLTFHGPKLSPRDPALTATMQSVSPGITRQTTMWRAWIGFNASHSFGALLFGVVYSYLALAEPAVLFGSVFLGLVGLLLLLGYAALGWLYWFSAPLRGITLALLLYVGGYGFAVAG